MKTPLPPSQLDTLLYGKGIGLFVREFVTNSGLFWLFDAIRVIATDGVLHYLGLSHLLLLGASLSQTLALSRQRTQRAWAANFIAPLIYSMLDIVLEGAEFFSKPYHLYFWLYAALMALWYATRPYQSTLAAIGTGITRTSLLGVMYMLTEWERTPQHPTLVDYWLYDPGHRFILLGSLMFGVLLGISTLMRDRFERLLRSLATHLEQITNWVFDPQLVLAAYHDEHRLALQRVERTILFMDIRGFTAWSESHDAAEVVAMLNAYYAVTEQIVNDAKGFKIQLTADEIMTRFTTAEAGMAAALALQQPIHRLLARYGLAAGIGLHTGEVIEGIIGSETTKQYGIIGDSVNTAARLQSAAQGGEIVVSEQTWRGLQQHPPIITTREVSAKGKRDVLLTYVVGLAT